MVHGAGDSRHSWTAFHAFASGLFGAGFDAGFGVLQSALKPAMQSPGLADAAYVSTSALFTFSLETHGEPFFALSGDGRSGSGFAFLGVVGSKFASICRMPCGIAAVCRRVADAAKLEPRQTGEATCRLGRVDGRAPGRAPFLSNAGVPFAAPESGAAVGRNRYVGRRCTGGVDLEQRSQQAVPCYFRDRAARTRKSGNLIARRSAMPGKRSAVVGGAGRVMPAAGDRQDSLRTDQSRQKGSRPSGKCTSLRRTRQASIS